MIIRLHSKRTITGSIVNEVLDEFAEITNSLCRSLQLKVRQFMDFDDSNVIDLLDSFEIGKSFEGLRTINQQMEAIKCSTEYIESEKIPLATCINNILDRKTGTFEPTKIVETCQHIPIIDSLSMVLRNKEIRDIIEAERESSYGILASFIDGEHFKNHTFFQKYKHTIKIQPPHMNSELSSIHVLLLCCHVDIKKYTLNKVLSHFLKDLAKLKSDEGVPILLEKEKYTLRALLAAFCGDGLSMKYSIY
ncbi:hypothetical protein ALC62_12740 [Cyphomyrmex costatus]|uniref:Uncharacterized protein n=1 Tax=Cyphomyrmex costatus TaxID=456900 RepID=A0A151IAT5_9HYME|nr:hypothetical protein ALC62_12740 [Cyphomyrmex costatus]